MFTLEGDFGRAIFSTSSNSSGQSGTRYMTLSTEAMLSFFKRISILKSNLVNNSYGLYSFARADRHKKVRFASLSTPKHLLSSRKNGCSWNPKGSVNMNSSEVTLCSVEYNGEQCPDAFYGSCLEQIFGSGNDVRDFFATPEGVALFGQLLELIYAGLGNSLYDLVWYGQHPLITESNANEWYGVDDKEWANYRDQQDACGGLMTMVDWFKKDGLENYNVQIPKADISADGTRYIGSATDLFDTVLAKQNTEMKLASKRSTYTSLRAVLLVDAKIFKKYEEELTAQWSQIPAMFQYFYNGTFCQEIGCSGSIPVEGVLKYKGHMVVCMDEWTDFDTITGTNTFRVMAVTPGVFGIAYDLESLNQFNGLGLKLTQHLDAPFQGKVFMDTTFNVGTGILDEKFIVNASLTLVPNN